MSWFNKLKQWFARASSSSCSFDPKLFERMCLEDPETARQMLAADQRELADELEKTYAAYQEKLLELSSKLKTLTPEEVRREGRIIREAQDAIRQVLLRIEASTRSARELARELKEWEAREEDSAPRHAHHPVIRAEIIRSELASRKIAPELRAIPIEESPFAPTLERHCEEVRQLEDDEAILHKDRHVFQARDDESIHPNPEHLLKAIRQAKREADLWHGSPEAHEESLDQLKHLRYLHGILKRLDREQGVRRDRYILAPRMH